MRVLAFLQNQWFKNPVKVQEIYDRNPEQRNQLIARFLFMGCLTGRRLREAFGDLCDEIVWEEISPRIGGYASSRFEPDLDHVRGTIRRVQPTVVLAFGKIATSGVQQAMLDVWSNIGEWAPGPGHYAVTLVTGPHPAARSNPMPELNDMAKRVKELVDVG